MYLTPWRNGSASDSRSEGCVFESRRGHIIFNNPKIIFKYTLPSSVMIKRSKKSNLWIIHIYTGMPDMNQKSKFRDKDAHKYYVYRISYIVHTWIIWMWHWFNPLLLPTTYTGWVALMSTFKDRWLILAELIDCPDIRAKGMAKIPLFFQYLLCTILLTAIIFQCN